MNGNIVAEDGMHVVCGSPARAHLAYGCRHVSTSRTRKPDVTTRRERHRAGVEVAVAVAGWWWVVLWCSECSRLLCSGGGRSVVIRST